MNVLQVVFVFSTAGWLGADGSVFVFVFFLNVFIICICDEYGWLAGSTWQCREEGNGFLSVPLMDLWPLSSSLLFIIARCCFVFQMYLLPECRMYFSPKNLFGVLLIIQVFSVILLFTSYTLRIEFITRVE